MLHSIHLVNSWSRDGNHEFTTCEWNAFLTQIVNFVIMRQWKSHHSHIPRNHSGNSSVLRGGTGFIIRSHFTQIPTSLSGKWEKLSCYCCLHGIDYETSVRLTSTQFLTVQSWHWLVSFQFTQRLRQLNVYNAKTCKSHPTQWLLTFTDNKVETRCKSDKQQITPIIHNFAKIVEFLLNL